MVLTKPTKVIHTREYVERTVHMITLLDFVTMAKKQGVIDDSKDKHMDFGAVLGFCTLNNGATGVLLNDTYYTINEAYIGPDKLIHYSEWYISGVVTKEKMHLASGVKLFNATVPIKTRRIKRVMLLDGTKLGDFND